jgi:insulysin
LYRTQQFTPEQIQAWESSESIDERLKLPELNGYIPTDFSLRCDDNAVGATPTVSEAERNVAPKKVWERDGLRLWHKMDKYWRVPKAFIRLSLVSPNVYRSPRTMTYNRIYQRMLNDDLKSTVYDASLAGCNYR